MAQKTINISLINEDIIIKCNNDIVLKIEKNKSSITGEDIFESLNFEKNDIYVLDQMMTGDENEPRYKVYSEIYNLYRGIIDAISNIAYQQPDIDIEDKAPYCVEDDN